MSITLRDYQIDICDQVHKLDHPLIPLPTGDGKSVIAAALIKAATDRAQHALFVVHRRELVLQASTKLDANGLDHATLMGAESTTYIGRRCVAASMVGRILRPHPGKVGARILDHSGVVYRRGYPDGEIEWALDPDEQAVNVSEAARNNGSHERELTTWPRCAAVRMEGEGCHVCGWSSKTKPRYLAVEDGELGEVRRDRAAPRPTEWSTSEQLAFYGQLMWIARQRQYRDDWAAHKFRERCGRFPPWEWNRAAPIPAGGAVIAWVRSRNIAYAKATGASR